MRNVVRTLVVSGTIAVASLPFAAARAERSMPPQQSEPPSSAAPMSPSAPTQAQQKARSEEGGIVQLVDEALSRVNLSKDQTEALRPVGADVDEKVGAVDQAKREMLRDLAQQIESGSINETALQPKIDTVADAAAAAWTRDREPSGVQPVGFHLSCSSL